MNSIHPDQYSKAWNYASLAHKGQLVPGTEIPYINHVGLVAMEAMVAILYSENIHSPNLLVVCAVLHDTIEDTKSTYEDLQQEFGTAVANGVLALSKKTSYPSKEAQMRDSLVRIKNEPKEIWMVKLADRITNLQPPPHYWSVEKITKYKIEAQLIHKELGEANAYLAKRLSLKINEYQHYANKST